MKEIVNRDLVIMSKEDTEENLKEEPSALMRGKPVVTVPLNIFIDDLSANQSKRWSPLHSIQCQLSGLPISEKSKGKHVLFLGLSDRMAMTELLVPVCKDIDQCKRDGIEAYDAFNKQNVIVTTDVSLIITDFMMMSLACNHLGPAANKFCPKCLADETDPFNKFQLRNKDSTMRTMERLAIVRDKSSLQRQTGIKLYENCLWDYMDPHKETPLGILHFLYLGLAKQLVKFCFETLDDSHKQLLETHLDSIDQSTFSYRVNSSIFKYIDSRQGKDFKQYIAVVNMHFAGLRQKYLCVVEKLARISKHITGMRSTNSIENEMHEYMVLVETNIPELGKKRKTHLGVHLGDDMARHGHPLHYSEDAFEKNHKVIRASIAHQNAHARSRDTATQFANSELMSHLISGGYIPDSSEWRTAGSKVMAYANERQILKYLGMWDGNIPDSNKLKKITSNQISEVEFSQYEVQILQAIINNGGNPNSLPEFVQEYERATVRKEETVKKEDFVVYMDEDNQMKMAQITKLLQLIWKGNRLQIAILRNVKEVFGDDLDFQRITPDYHTTVVNLDTIRSAVHVVHDCKGAKCHLKEGTMNKKIEQHFVDVKCVFLKHNMNYNVFIINKCRFTHCFDKFTF